MSTDTIITKAGDVFVEAIGTVTDAHRRYIYACIVHLPSGDPAYDVAMLSLRTPDGASTTHLSKDGAKRLGEALVAFSEAMP